ncbi:TIGR00725 family protein [SAR202 cluster bacterium AD-804-J14_MRT_500m]|nr:TIGR00725 family protein [SAR202 cluster bacterium AD-804-J14_MRT_500m]
MEFSKKPLIIAVIGGGFPPPQAYDDAYNVGIALAKRGVVVVCGGLSGVMEAVCKGSKEAGGTTIGILPGNEPDNANSYVDIPICTGLSYARNVLVVKTGRAVIAIDGSYGTMSEIAHALSDQIPVIGLNTWTFSIGGEQDSAVIRASDPLDAVNKAIFAAQQRVSKRINPRPIR